MSQIEFMEIILQTAVPSFQPTGQTVIFRITCYRLAFLNTQAAPYQQLTNPLDLIYKLI